MSLPVELSHGNRYRSTVMAHALLLSETFSLQQGPIVEINDLNGYKHHLSRTKWSKCYFKNSSQRALYTWIIATCLQLIPAQAFKYRAIVFGVGLRETTLGTRLHVCPKFAEDDRCASSPGGRRPGSCRGRRALLVHRCTRRNAIMQLLAS